MLAGGSMLLVALVNCYMAASAGGYDEPVRKLLLGIEVYVRTLLNQKVNFMYKKLYFSLLPLFASSAIAPVYAQSCSCPQIFEQYVTWVEENYVGYVMEVRDGDPVPYEQRTTEYRRRAQRTPLAQCIHLTMTCKILLHLISN